MKRCCFSTFLAIAVIALTGGRSAWADDLPYPRVVQDKTAPREALPVPKGGKEASPPSEPGKAEAVTKEVKEQPKAPAAEEPKAVKEEAKEAPKEAPKEAATKEEPKGEAPKEEPKPSPLDELKKSVEDLKGSTTTGIADAKVRGDSAWMLTASAFVMLMLPGLALFYGGMVRRKNVLATMMQSMAALAVVGLYWIAVGYGLAFGPSLIKIGDGGLVGWHSDLFFLRGINSDTLLPATNVTVYAHVMFQGMFAIITPALISGAIAERIRFWPFCIFMILWVTFVYCPLAHMVWAFDWFYIDPIDEAKGLGGTAIGLLGNMGTYGAPGALDFAGGTVVHIAAGMAGLACALVLRKRTGYPDHAMHPNSMVLTLLGAGLLWFGWFGFNGGSAVASSSLSTSAFSATQAAAAAAGLSWVVVEWLMKGKPTALGLASGIVAGLVAVTPASGYVYMWGGALIGIIAGVVCYFSVAMKSLFGYDDSLDAFGVHGVGGFLGAILTGLLSYTLVNPAGADGYFGVKYLQSRPDAIKKEAQQLKPEIDKLEAEAKSYEPKIKDAEAAVEKATGKDAKEEAEKDLKSLKDKQAAANGGATRRKDKLTKLRDEYASLVGEEGVTKLIDSKEAEKLGLEWSKDELAGDKIKGQDGTIKKMETDKRGPLTQFFIQVKAAVASVVFAFVVSLILAVAVQVLSGGNFSTDVQSETEGLDRTEHGEVGFDYGPGLDTSPGPTTEPRAAKAPPGTEKRFGVVLEGIENGTLIRAWSDLCKPVEHGPIDPDFKAVYPHVTTVSGNKFRLRGGDPQKLSMHLQRLFQKVLGDKNLKVRIEQ